MSDRSQIEALEQCIQALYNADCSDKEEMHQVVKDVADCLAEIQTELQIDLDEAPKVVVLVPPVEDEGQRTWAVGDAFGHAAAAHYGFDYVLADEDTVERFLRVLHTDGYKVVECG